MNKNEIQALGLVIFERGTIEDQPFEDVLSILQLSDQVFHDPDPDDEIHEPFLTDNQYDYLRQYAQSLIPHHVYFTGVGSSVRGGKVKLPYDLGSLDQVEIGEIVAWIIKWELLKYNTVVTDKLDGISCLIIYGTDGRLQIAFSRGDGTHGADIHRHIKKFDNIPALVPKSIAVRGEIIFDFEGFERVRGAVTASNGEPYKNARNMAAGIMNAKTHSPANSQLIYSNIKFIAYDILNYGGCSKTNMLSDLESMGFETPHQSSFKGNELTDVALAKHLNERRDASQYEIDGVVIDVDDATKRQQMNPQRHTLNPAYAIKYKVADAGNLAEAEVIGVLWRASKHKYLKPTILIKPVKLVGVTVSKCTGFNARFIYENKIQPGCKIHITRSGDVIPLCLGVVEEGPLS